MRRTASLLLVIILLLLPGISMCDDVRLHLQSGNFDPLSPVVPDAGQSSLFTAPEDTRFHIVQCKGPILADWRLMLESKGLVILEYVPDFGYLVRMGDLSLISEVRKLDFVRWVGPYVPAYKIEEGLLEKSDKQDVDITVVMFSGEDASTLAGIASSSVIPQRLSECGNRQVMQVKGKRGLITQLAQHDGVAWIEEKIEPAILNNVARGFMGVTKAWQDAGIYGQGQIVAVCDTGLDAGSTTNILSDFQGRVISGLAYGRSGDWSDPHGHGTHVAGSVLGSGILSGSSPSTHTYGNSFAGSAPEAKLIFQSVLDSENGFGGLNNGVSPILQDAYNAGARIHTNSWGEPASAGKYKILSQEVDQFCWNHKDMLVLFAAGNDGTDQLSPYGVIDPGSVTAPSTAKDCVTVGASENLRSSGGYQSAYGDLWSGDFFTSPIATDTPSNNTSGIAAFSSRGPTTDGRIKPDIVAPGTNIISCKSRYTSSDGWGTYDSNYIYMGGTSMACPLTAGAAALVREYYVKKKAVTNPSAALLKATLLNGALDLNPGQYGTGSAREMNARPNNAEGWGRVDVSSSIAATGARSMAHIDNNTGLSTGASATYTYSVSDTTAPFKATLVWTDYPASTTAYKTLVNDLDLTVTAPGGTVYKGNGTTDRVNNVEGVDIAAPAAGTYTVRVTAYNVPNGPQPFALVVSGGLPATFIRGTITTSTGTAVSDVLVTAGSYSAYTDSSGAYAIRVPAGNYTVTPSKTNWTFTPAIRSVTVPTAGITGINFSGSAPAGSVQGFVALWKGASAESSHPYNDSYDYTWTLTGVSGASYTMVHFDYIYLEDGYDYLYVMDANGNVINEYTGYHDDLWSDMVPGSQVKVRLVSDDSINDDGFVVDNVGSVKSGIPVVAQPGNKQGLTNTVGDYTISGLLPGSYTIKPVLSGWGFYPTQENVTVAAGETVTDKDFLGYTYSSISGKVTSSTTSTIAHVTQSPHPYTNEYNYTWTVTAPAGSVRTRAHFNYIDTEDGYDYVEILDGSQNVVTSYTGHYDDIWSPWVSGSTMYIRLTTDYSVSDYSGFYSDSIQVEGNVTGLAGVVVTATPSGKKATTAADGSYTITDLDFGDYTVEPTSSSWSFDPVRRTVSLDPGSNESNVDFHALPPGSVSGKVISANISTVSEVKQSSHPYANYSRSTWTVTAPTQAVSVRVHFQYIDLESDYDFLYVQNSTGDSINTYTGHYEDVWSDWIPGNQVNLSLTSDSSVTGNGFICDRYEYAVTGGGVAGVVVTASPGGKNATTASDGSYTITGLPEGSYEVTPQGTDFTYLPSSRQVQVAPGQVVRDINFMWKVVLSNISLSPKSGSVGVQTKTTLSARYADPAGYAHLGGCYLLINGTFSGANAIYLCYSENLNKLYLRNDANTAWLGSITPGTAAVIENSRCKIYGAETTVVKNGTLLTVNWKIEYKSPMSGKTCSAWMMVENDAKARKGWEVKGSLKFGHFPLNVSLTPSSATLYDGTKTTLRTVFSDGNGASNLRGVYFLLNTIFTGVNGVYLCYSENFNELYLRNDSNTAWTGSVKPGTATVLENSQCKLYCADTIVTKSGNQLIVDWSIELKPSLIGKNFSGWLTCFDDIDLRESWDRMGSYTVR